MKNGPRIAAIIKLIAWSIVLVVLITVLLSALRSGESGCKGGFSVFGGITYADPASYDVGSREYSGELSCIYVDWQCGQLKLEVYDGETVKLEEDEVDDDDLKLRSKLVNGELTVKYMNSGLKLFSSYPKKTLTIYVPQKYATAIAKLDIDSASAKLEINSIVADEVDISTASGRIELNECTVERLDISTSSSATVLSGSYGRIDIDTSSGNIDIKGKAVTLDVDTASGKVNFEGTGLRYITIDAASAKCSFRTDALPESIDVDTASGDVELFAPIADDGFKVECSTASGKATVRYLAGNKVSGKELTVGNGKYKYKLSSASGSFIFNET